jgi:hypothetical protein
VDNLHAIPGATMSGNFRLFCALVARHCSFGQYVRLAANWSFEA